MVIGLTGGIGCGKTAAARFFEPHGFVIVEADQLARQALNEPASLAAIEARWGRECLRSDGSPNREWIGRKVFADTAERTFLESLLHPRVAVLRAQATADRKRSYVVEIPLLFELGLEGTFDAVVCVACSDAVRLNRLENRGLSREQAVARISSQMPISDKVKKSKFVIWNDGDLDFLQAEVDRLVVTLRQ